MSKEEKKAWAEYNKAWEKCYITALLLIVTKKMLSAAKRNLKVSMLANANSYPDVKFDYQRGMDLFEKSRPEYHKERKLIYELWSTGYNKRE